MEKENNCRFPFEDEKGWRTHLDTQGYVVIANWVPR